MTDAHCPWPDCRCSHTDGCLKGWIDPDPPDASQPVAPCPICRPGLAAIIRARHRSQADDSHIRSREHR